MLLAYFPFSKLMHMGGGLSQPHEEHGERQSHEETCQPWNYPVKVHSYEEYERRVQGKDERGWDSSGKRSNYGKVYGKTQ